VEDVLLMMVFLRLDLIWLSGSPCTSPPKFNMRPVGKYIIYYLILHAWGQAMVRRAFMICYSLIIFNSVLSSCRYFSRAVAKTTD